MLLLAVLSFGLGASVHAQGQTYHVSMSTGDDSHPGTAGLPLQSLEALNALSLGPGDSVLFKAGDVWQGMFWPKGSGSEEAPIFIGRYGPGNRPVIDGDGYQACLLIYNDGYVVIDGLELTNEASHADEFGVTKKLDGFGGVDNGWGSGRDVRFGIKVVADAASFAHFRMDSLYIHDVFPTPISDQHIYKGYGIKFETQSNLTSASTVAGCGVFTEGVSEDWPYVLPMASPDSANSASEQVVSINVTSLPSSGAEYRILKTVANGNWSIGNPQPLSMGTNEISVSEVSFDRSVRLQISDGETAFDALTLNGNFIACGNAQADGLHLLSDVQVEACTIERTGHYGIWIKSLGLVGIDAFKNTGISILDCDFLYTGGSGFVPNKSEDVLVEGCTFNHTGSGIDPRMWNRGSGTWPFDCRDVVIQDNRFMNAHGPQDSYGAHIDYGNENVVIQYNLSYHNEGGFVEILGDNIRCGYRYNISVNDGYREDPEGDPWDKKGKIFWVGNYCGSSTVRCPSTETFIYNNTVFVNDTLFPEIYVWPEVGDVFMANNLIVATAEGEVIPTLIRNEDNTLDISHNLFFEANRFDLDSDLLTDAVFADPMILYSGTEGVEDATLYRLENESPAVGAGRLIAGSTDASDYLNHNGGRDYFGLPVSPLQPPNIGAYNGPPPYCGDGLMWDVYAGSCVPETPLCPVDLDGDGLVATSDLLVLLGVFGTPCP